MSYILDALRRADAERDRGAVPTLHARHEAAASEDEDPGRRRPWLALAGGAVALLATGAVAAWLLLGGDREPPRATTVAVGPSPVQPAPSPVSEPPTPAIAPVPVPAPTPAPPVAIAPAPVAVTRTVPPPATTAPTPAAITPSPVAPRPTRAAPPPPATVTSTVPATASPTRRADATAAASAPARGDAPADDRNRVYAAVDLPDAVKKDLPRVSISGGSWSRDKASRMVMVNGQVLHEGDTVVPGLTLDAIRPKSAVLAWRGYRYEMAY